MEEEKVIDKVPFKTFEKLYNKLVEEQNKYDTEFDISFEFIVASLFPSVWDNIKQALADEHTKGYIEGVNSHEN